MRNMVLMRLSARWVPRILTHEIKQISLRHRLSQSNLKFDLLLHPPYLPELTPPDFALIPKMKALLRGRIFEFRDNLESEGHRVLRRYIPKEVYNDAIGSLLRWKKFVTLKGGYIKKNLFPLTL